MDTPAPPPRRGGTKEKTKNSTVPSVASTRRDVDREHSMLCYVFFVVWPGVGGEPKGESEARARVFRLLYYLSVLFSSLCFGRYDVFGVLTKR